jgi:Papain family cysteine protease
VDAQQALLTEVSPLSYTDSTMLRKYGRRFPSPLPAHRMLSRITTVPDVADTRVHCGPIKDQGELGSCTGHAFSSAIEWIFRAYLGQSPVLSPLYLYIKELIADGNFPTDDGSTGLTGCNVAIANGCCLDALYPDASQTIKQTTAEMDANAALYRLGAYHGLTGSQVALSVLGDPTPWPVEIGFTVYASFESVSVASTGVYAPKPGEAQIGGHEVLMVGYDVGTVPTLRPSWAGPSALIQNSWGTGWGLGGYFWMPLSVLDASDTDLKIVHSGNPW